MLGLLSDSQKEIRDVQHEERHKRSKIRRSANAEIARIHAETEAAKERIDAAANYNANLIRRFGDSISNCKSAEELQRNWEELSSHLINF